MLTCRPRPPTQVLISYVLQVCFASFLFLSLKAFTLWVRFSQQSRASSLRPRRGRRGSTRLDLQRRLTRIESIIWRDSSALSRTSVALATTLVEFQEAQCWFVFAIHIASILAIVVNSQEGTFWGEIIVNAAVAFHISQNGVLPMFLVQLCLHNKGIRNWHIFVGFLAEYLLVATSQKVRFRDAFELFRKEREIEACGGNSSPRSYCASMQGVDGLNLGFFPRPYLYKVIFLVLDTVAIVVLLTDQLCWTLRTHRLTCDLCIRGHRLGRGPRGRLKRPWARLKRAVWWSLELAYLVINILYMVSLVKVFSTDSFEASKWSYGQIITMTVWGPVIVKLFDLVLCEFPHDCEPARASALSPPRVPVKTAMLTSLAQPARPKTPPGSTRALHDCASIMSSTTARAHRPMKTTTKMTEEEDDDDEECSSRLGSNMARPPDLDLGRSSPQRGSVGSADDDANEEMKRVEAGLRKDDHDH